MTTTTKEVSENLHSAQRVRPHREVTESQGEKSRSRFEAKIAEYPVRATRLMTHHLRDRDMENLIRSKHTHEGSTKAQSQMFQRAEMETVQDG